MLCPNNSNYSLILKQIRGAYDEGEQAADIITTSFFLTIPIIL